MRSHEAALAALVVAEIAIFAAMAPNFATTGNAAEIVRLSVEVGLLALALTPIVVTGEYDRMMNRSPLVTTARDSRWMRA